MHVITFVNHASYTCRRTFTTLAENLGSKYIIEESKSTHG